MDSQLHLSPITDPKRVLDIGTGTGVWAIEMGEGPSVVRVLAALLMKVSVQATNIPMPK
jgi:methylase of polypeptide subunit release factors